MLRNRIITLLALSAVLFGCTPKNTEPDDIKLSFNPSSVVLKVGESVTLHHVSMPVVPVSALKFRSEDEKIVTVSDEGVVTGVAVGSTKVRASYKGIRSAICYVAVEDSTPGPGPGPDGPEIKTPKYNVVAHRGRCRVKTDIPDDSIAGLEECVSYGVAGAECDAYITADREILLWHNTTVGTMVPSQKNLKELRTVSLSNGEKIPVLEDFIAFVTDRARNTCGLKVWIDFKPSTWIDGSTTVNDLLRTAADKVVAAGASKYFVFMIPTSESVSIETIRYVTDRIPEVCYNGGTNSAEEHLNRGLFVHRGYSRLFSGTSLGNATTFLNAGLQVSVYTTQSGVSREEEVGTQLPACVANYGLLRDIFTNYPVDCISLLEKAGY